MIVDSGLKRTAFTTLGVSATRCAGTARARRKQPGGHATACQMAARRARGGSGLLSVGLVLPRQSVLLSFSTQRIIRTTRENTAANTLTKVMARSIQLIQCVRLVRISFRYWQIFVFRQLAPLTCRLTITTRIIIFIWIVRIFIRIFI